MAIVFMMGDHPRHRFIANQLHKANILRALIIERRENFRPAPPPGIPVDLAKLFKRHFQERDETEHRFFGHALDMPEGLPVLEVTRDSINSTATQKFLASHPAEILLSYGVHLLSPETIDAAKVRYRWNIHGGLSPWYRGCTTHFWPSYMLEPQMTGFTVHELTNELDHGPVIHQSGTSLVRGDGLHDLACRAVTLLGEELPRLVELARKSDSLQGVPHRSSGKLWLARDWRAEHLRVIYEQYDNRIVDRCLDKEIIGREPELIRQW